MTRFLSRLTLLSPALSLLLALAAGAETRSLLILHTNDLHAHVRSGTGGTGGLPYIAGYAAQQREKRNDVLLLDAGDVTEKGDMVAFETQNKVTYEAMGRMKYDAAVPGNHDFSLGMEHLEACRALLGSTAYLCINCLNDAGKPRWEASRVFEVNGLRVGVIGATTETDKGKTLDLNATADRIAEEAARLDKDCQVLIVLAHLGVEDCRTLAGKVPSIDVFVGGHTHELLRTPARAENGAIIVQTGNYAERIGSVDLAVDRSTREVKLVKGGVIEMSHDAVPCDQDMLARIRAEEQRVCPEAARVVGRAEKPIREAAMGRIAAAALREKAGADVGFCHPNQIMRSSLEPGEVDVNALFLTGGQRGSTLVTAKLRGRDIEAYLSGLYRERKGLTAWSGFTATVTDTGATGDLEPERVYTIVMPEVEWKSRLLKVWEKSAGTPPAAEPCTFSFIDALADYIAHATGEGKSVDQLAASPGAPRKAKTGG
jgi:2',3'-cyclic-nucleotide 2'-phosphodiesterase (5'-nucleotidase family)